MSVAVSLGARNLVTAYCDARHRLSAADDAAAAAARAAAGPGAELVSVPPPQPDLTNRLLDFLASPRGQQVAVLAVTAFVTGGMRAYLDQTIDINFYEVRRGRRFGGGQRAAQAAAPTARALLATRSVLLPPLPAAAWRAPPAGPTFLGWAAQPEAFPLLHRTYRPAGAAQRNGQAGAPGGGQGLRGRVCSRRGGHLPGGPESAAGGGRGAPAAARRRAACAQVGQPAGGVTAGRPGGGPLPAFAGQVQLPMLPGPGHAAC